MGTEEESLCLQFNLGTQQILKTMRTFFFTNILFLLLFGHKFETAEVQQTSNVLLPFRVKERLVIGKRPEHWILNAQGVVRISNNAFVVSDKLDYKLKKFDLNGKIIVEVGKRGKGPGEFRGPGPLDFYKDIIAVADFASPRVQIFSSSLEYKTSFRAPGPVFDLCFDEEGDLWLGVLTGRANQNLCKVDLSGKVVHTIRLRNTTDSEFDQLFSFSISQAGDIIIAYAYQNKIEIWNRNGNFMNEFQVPGIPLRPKKKTISRGLFKKGIEVPEDDLFRSVVVDSKNNIFVLADSYTNNQGRDIYVLNSNGQLISLVTLPYRSYGINIGPRDELYSIEENRTLIRVYQLKQERNEASDETKRRKR